MIEKGKSGVVFLGALLGAMMLALALGGPMAMAQGGSYSTWAFETRWGVAPPAGQFNFPRSAAVGTDGRLYVVDMENHRVQVFQNGAAVNTFGGLGSGPGQFYLPKGVAVNSSEVYVSDTGNGRIEVFSLAGSFLRAFGAPGSGPGQLEGPGGLAVTPSQVCVADRGNNRIACFNGSTGAFIKNVGGPGSGNGQFSGPTDVAHNAATNEFCVLDELNSRVQLFDQDWVFKSAFGTVGAGNLQFQSPTGLGVDASGRIYVADSNNRVQVFDQLGVFLFKVGTPGGGNGQLSFPQDVAPGLGANPNFYVADGNNNRIEEFDGQHAFASAFGSRGQVAGQFNAPGGLGIGLGGALIVADTNNGRLQIARAPFGASPPAFEVLGAPGGGPAEFNFPAGVAGATDGKYYVADTLSHRIQIVNPDGSIHLSVGGPGNGNGQFASPADVALSPYSSTVMGEIKAAARFYVADTNNHRIQSFDLAGTFVAKWGGQGALDSQFLRPRAVAVAPDGNVYVADTGNNRIQYFSPTGTFINKWGSRGGTDGKFSFPSGIAIGADGLVYVADAGNARVQVFTPTGGFVAKFGSSGLNPGQFNFLSAVAVLGRHVFVADSSSNVINVFQRINYIALPLMLKLH